MVSRSQPQGAEKEPLPPIAEPSAASGYITPRLSWPRPATPTDMAPAWAGEFCSFQDWVSFATNRLTGTCDPLMGGDVKAICIDNIGRRCTMGGHFMRAKDEGTFPVRFFWDCAPREAESPSERQPQIPGSTQ